jgi:hypothetical protein
MKDAKQKAEELQSLLLEKTGLNFTLSLGATGKNYTLQGPQGSLMFWVSEEKHIVYLVDILADAPTVLETVLFLLGHGLDLVYSGPYVIHPNEKEYVIGSDAYSHKETWLRKLAGQLESRIILPS